MCVPFETCLEAARRCIYLTWAYRSACRMKQLIMVDSPISRIIAALFSHIPAFRVIGSSHCCFSSWKSALSRRNAFLWMPRLNVLLLDPSFEVSSAHWLSQALLLFLESCFVACYQPFAQFRRRRLKGCRSNLARCQDWHLEIVRLEVALVHHMTAQYSNA